MVIRHFFANPPLYTSFTQSAKAFGSISKGSSIRYQKPVTPTALVSRLVLGCHGKPESYRLYLESYKKAQEGNLKQALELARQAQKVCEKELEDKVVLDHRQLAHIKQFVNKLLQVELSGQ